jgi:PleD family two-component response regulator
VCNLLEVHQYRVIAADDGVEALKKIQENPDVDLVITDYEMPKMDGFALTQKIREKHDKNEIAVIGISGHDEHDIAVRFLKNGANDFIIKPFFTEEFYCRVTQNVETVESFRRLKQVQTELTRLKDDTAKAGG